MKNKVKSIDRKTIPKAAAWNACFHCAEQLTEHGDDYHRAISRCSCIVLTYTKFSCPADTVRLAERSKAAASGAVLLRKARVRTPQRTDDVLRNIYFLLGKIWSFCKVIYHKPDSFLLVCSTDWHLVIHLLLIIAHFFSWLDLTGSLLQTRSSEHTKETVKAGWSD